MKTEMQTAELVAIEEASLETVAGGSDLSFPVDITKTVQIALDFNHQNNSIDFSYNDIQAVGPAVFQFTQQNVNGKAG
jgi:hypothetical protein